MSVAQAEVALRRAVVQVAALNLAYFFVEFAVARRIGSVSLFADSIDFLEDASVNFLVLVALGWSAKRRAGVGFVLALLLLVPGMATAWMAWQKFNVTCAARRAAAVLWPALARWPSTCTAPIYWRGCATWRAASRAPPFSRRATMPRQTSPSSRPRGVTVLWASAWPDLIVGVGIFLLNLGAAHEVFEAARKERRESA